MTWQEVLFARTEGVTLRSKTAVATVVAPTKQTLAQPGRRKTGGKVQVRALCPRGLRVLDCRTEGGHPCDVGRGKFCACNKRVAASYGL